MRILHTADLHYGMTWDGQRRIDDQERVLDELLALCETHNVDLLLVAGDVFHDRVAGGHIAMARRLLTKLLPELRRGRAIFLLRGNHDPLDLFRLMSLALEELAGEQHLPLVVAWNPGIYAVPGHTLQVLALPYVTPRMLQDSAAQDDITVETEVAQLSGKLALLLERLYPRVAGDRPAIFAGHVSLTGASVTPDFEFESGYHRELWLEPARLPQFTSYNALGHIHLSQQVRGAGKPTWYAGAPDRLNLGEREYTPQVLLVETPETAGGSATVTPLPIAGCTPFVQLTLDGQEAIDAFCATTWACDPLGRVTLSGIQPAARRAVEGQLREVAPRLRIFWDVQRAEAPTPDGGLDYHDVYGTVSAYLAKAFAERPERRAQLEEAFASLWSEYTEESPA